MSNIMIRPDLRTASGEVNDILLNGRYAGSLTLVYREGQRITGSVQLEKESLKRKDKNKVIDQVEIYVQALIDALDVPECDVLVTYSNYDRLIVTEQNIGEISEFTDQDETENEDNAVDYEYDYVDNETHVEDFDYHDVDEYKLNDKKDKDNDTDAIYYELVIVGESRNTVEYHVYDKNKKWMAEAYMTIYGNDVVGEVNWRFLPSEDEIGHVTDLIVSDFDENEIDSFLIEVKHDGEVIDVEELTHEDYITDNGLELPKGIDDYSVVLSRDDADTLTYEIYRQSHGGIPIGTATIDISQRHLTGFIDFKELEDEHNREHIATLLMNELDKEKEYESFNLTILHHNEPIDEILFETDQIH
jgi:hypothetical protein